jgi:hypothetical protein
MSYDRRAHDQRAPHDGEPFYCATCGLGLGEVMACEEGACEFESRATAQQRRALHEARAH